MSRPAAIAVLGLVAATAAVILTVFLDSGERTDVDDAPPAKNAVGAPSASVVQPAAQVLPSFDVIRVGEGGNAVLAGRAAPKAVVTVWDGERELGHVTADERGEWVLVPSLPLPAGVRMLAVHSREVGASESLVSQPVTVTVGGQNPQPAK